MVVLCQMYIEKKRQGSALLKHFQSIHFKGKGVSALIIMAYTH